MSRLKAHEIKREQKKSLFLRHITNILQTLAQDEPVVAKVYPTRVDFSADTGMCYVYFATFDTSQDAQEAFNDALKVLKLYKGSLRTALAKQINGRYTPDLIFLFDTTTEKVRKINELLDKVQEDLHNLPEEDMEEA